MFDLSDFSSLANHVHLRHNYLLFKLHKNCLKKRLVLYLEKQ